MTILEKKLLIFVGLVILITTLLLLMVYKPLIFLYLITGVILLLLTGLLGVALWIGASNIVDKWESIKK